MAKSDFWIVGVEILCVGQGVPGQSCSDVVVNQQAGDVVSRLVRRSSQLAAKSVGAPLESYNNQEIQREQQSPGHHSLPDGPALCHAHHNTIGVLKRLRYFLQRS